MSFDFEQFAMKLRLLVCKCPHCKQQFQVVRWTSLSMNKLNHGAAEVAAEVQCPNCKFRHTQVIDIQSVLES